MRKKTTLFILLVTSNIIFGTFVFAQKNWIQGAGSNANDEALDVVHDIQGNIYSTGYFSQSARFDNSIVSSSGMSDVFIAKQDSLVKFLWVVTAGGAMDERATGISVNSSGEIFITGVFRGTSQFGSISLTSTGSSQDIFIAKFDNNGAFIWAQNYGGADTDLANDISVDANGSIIIAGQFKGVSQFGNFPFTSMNYPDSMPLNGGLPSYDAILFKTNSAGNVTWAKQGAAIYDDRILKVMTDDRSNIYACGQFSDTLTFSNTYNNNAFNAGFIMMFDSTGNETWFKRLLATQFMIYDMKISGNNLWLTGDFQGTLVYIGKPNNYMSNSYPNKVFALKIQKSTGNFISGASEGSDNALSSRGICIDAQNNVYTTGYFKCSFSPFSNAHGNGVFYSVGYRDVYVIKYDSLLQRTWEKQYGGIGDDYPTSLSIHYNNQPVFAGSYTKNFNAAAGTNFVTHKNNLLTYNTNSGSAICGNNLYGNFMTQKGWGNKDILIARPTDLNCPLYDYFKRINGTCVLDTLMPARFPSIDTIKGCDKVLVFVITPTTTDSLQAPEWVYNWSNGINNDSSWLTTSGWHYINYGYVDNCRNFVDSFYVQIDPTPALPIINVYDAFMLEAIPIRTCLKKAVIFTGSTAIFAASNIGVGCTFEWTLPDGTKSTTDTIYASQAGVYSIITTSAKGLCTNYNCVELMIWGPGGNGNCNNLNLFVPQIIFTDSVFNTTDTVTVCKNDYFEMQVVDSTLFSNNIGTILNTFVTWDITGGYSFDPYLSFTNTFGEHKQKFKADSSGNCIATAYILNPLDGSVFGSVNRNFYLDVHEPPSNIPVISGDSFFCPGDTVILKASGGDNYVWSGPGIVQINTPENDSAYVNTLGIYSITSTTIDPVLGCWKKETTKFTLNSIPAPIVTMNPSHGVICPFDSVLLSAETGGNYIWYGPTGNIISTSQTVWVSTPGIYYYTFISGTGCSLVSDMAEVKEYSTPYLDAFPGTSLCANGSVLISVESNETALVTWGPPFNGNSFSQVVNSAGIYSVSVNFCNITTLANININNSAGTPVSIIYTGPDTVCTNDTIVLIASTGYVKYKWYPSQEEGAAFVTTGGGTFYVQAYNDQGCLSGDSITIFSYPTITAPTIKDTAVCAESSVTLTVNASGTVAWYDQFFGGNLIATGQSITVNIKQNDTILFAATTNGNCFSERVPVKITVHPASKKPFIIAKNYVCAGDSIVLQIQNPINGINYTWNGPGVNNVNAAKLTIHPATTANTGNYRVYASNNSCNSIGDSINIFVHDIQLKTFSNSSYTICQYDSVLLKTDSLFGSYLWNNNIALTEQTITQAGQYYYIYTDSIGCKATSDTVNVIVLPAPVTLILPDTSVCTNSPLTLTATSDPSLTINWYDSQLILLHTGINYPISQVNQNTTLIVESMGINGCKSKKDTLQIIILPAISSPLLNSDTALCEGSILNLSATDLPGHSYFWTGPSGFSSNLVNPSYANITTTNAGIYSLHVMNGYCKSNVGTFELTIISLPILTTSGNTAICIDDTAHLNANSSVGNLIWSTGETANDIYISPQETKIYTVETTNTCATVSQNIKVTVNQLPNVNAGPDFTMLLGESVNLKSSQGSTYLWYPAFGLSCTDCKEPVVTIDQPQYFYVIVTDANGCSNIDSVFVDVKNVYTLYIPTAFSPNNDGLNDEFLVQGNEIKNVHMLIFDRWGNKLFESNDKNGSWNGTCKGNPVESGTYVYKIKALLNNGEEYRYTGALTVVK
ncbi:MAG: gliding motility-associated C-terminal domain-containing protein [Bacteroidota bacterium]